MQKGRHLDIFNVLGEYLNSHEKRGHVLQKEDVWWPYLTMLLISDCADAISTRNE